MYNTLLISVNEDMSEIDEKQMVLYAQMANLVSFILQRPDINIKEIAENFSKVCIKKQFLGSFLFPDEKELWFTVSITEPQTFSFQSFNIAVVNT